MEAKKKYTREEKIRYYMGQIIKFQSILDRLMSDDYQDWESKVSSEIAKLKAKQS